LESHGAATTDISLPFSATHRRRPPRLAPPCRAGGIPFDGARRPRHRCASARASLPNGPRRTSAPAIDMTIRRGPAGRSAVRVALQSRRAGASGCNGLADVAVAATGREPPMAIRTSIFALLCAASLQAAAAATPDAACVGTYRLQDGRDVDLALSGETGYRWRMPDG